MPEPFNIRILGTHASIRDLEWNDVPPFAILTGVNGAGKSQLLRAIAALCRASGPNFNRGIGPVDLNVFDGKTYDAGEVYFSDGNWPNIQPPKATVDQIKNAINRLHSDRKHVQFWKSLAEKIGSDIETAQTLSLPDFTKQITPGNLIGNDIPDVAPNLSFLFLAYKVLARQAKELGLTDEQIINGYGEPPWNLMNEILETSGLPFEVKSPEIDGALWLDSQQHEVVLFDKQLGTKVPFEGLSSGEKVIMATTFWRYAAETIGGHYKLLLLDEPDAHLHPSLTRRFLDVIQKVFVEERGVRVIMTTHSPSTVSLAPDESIFEMQKTEPRIRKAEIKSAVIAKLTDGFVSVLDATQTVFLEGNSDPNFYNMVWNLLTERSEIADSGPLERYPNIQFMHGQGKDSINLIVPQLRESGFSMFHGLIDMDKGNEPGEGVHVLKRYSMENYLCDPLNIWALLHQEGKAPDVDGVNVPQGRTAHIRNLPVEKLQLIVDSIFDAIHKKSPKDEDKLVPVTIDYVDGISLKYPKWFLYQRGKDVLAEFRKALGPKSFWDDKLLAGYATVNLIPLDLLELFKTIQCSGMSDGPK